jgi:hypothetical protein
MHMRRLVVVELPHHPQHLVVAVLLHVDVKHQQCRRLPVLLIPKAQQ